MATHDDQLQLLEEMSRMGSAGRAEGEDAAQFPRTFLPVPEHLRAFDPDVVLVVGPRGAGKTELFRAVVEEGLLPKVSERIPGLRLPPLDRSKWLSGYSSRGTGFPSEPLFRAFFEGQTATDEVFLDLWIAYLVRALKDELPCDELSPIFAPQGGDIGAVLGAYRQVTSQALLALDALDERLDREDRYVLVAYDELDTLARDDWARTRMAVRGLVALWATHSRRWRRLRAKIFLRSDLYERAATAGGADFAKLMANRVQISWSDQNLLAMLTRRLVNTGDRLLQYCRQKIEVEDAGDLGFFPVIRKAQDVRPLIERIVGIYMGASVKKGLAFRWVLDHIRDGHGQALPRPLVRLFEAAAYIQQKSGSLPRWPRLLEPRALRRALDKVSEDHVKSAFDEWPWLERLQRALATRREVPWERREIERHLDKALHETWEHSDVRPPATSGREMVDYLIEVGIFRPRRDGRVDVPDLFLFGLGLKRKGGVAKK